MKILFIVASLESGRDGIGDYVRILAGALLKLGHTIVAISINDKFVTEEIAGTQYTDGFDLEVVRIPSCWSERRRFQKAIVWITFYDPEWISLQFVIFSFHKKGLPINFGKYLKVLGHGRKLHIMFHELWVGMAEDSNKKMILWGWVQKQLIRNLLNKLRPILINTQTRIYQAQLIRLGFPTMYLPLFGNIPVNEEKNSICREIDKSAKNEISFILFGSIHPGAPIQKLANDLANYSKQFNILISLRIIGRSGIEQESWAKIWTGAGLKVELFGELSTENISEKLSSSTLGISTTPIALAEKSGTIAAMKEHGLKVMCVSHPWKERNSLSFADPAGVMQYDGSNLNEILKCNIKLPVGSPINLIALQLIANYKIRSYKT